MFSYTSAGIGVLSGFGLAQVTHFLSDKGLTANQKPRLDISAYGFKEVVIITPIVEEVVRFGFESLIESQLNITSRMISATGASALMGFLHLCNGPDRSFYSFLTVSLKSICFTYLRESSGWSTSLIAHSVNNLVEYRSSQ